MTPFIPFSQLPEEVQKAMLLKARLAREANSAARKSSNLRKDFLDSSLWEDLARERNLLLPPLGKPCTVSFMRTWLYKIGWSQEDWEKENGCKLKQFSELNPLWPLRAWAGLTLECLADREKLLK